MSTDKHNNSNHSNDKSVDEVNEIIALPGDERDVLISRVIDGVASAQDWATFRGVAAHDPSIWSELAETQSLHESVSMSVADELGFVDQIELPGGVMDDQPLRARLDLISRWGGWAAAAAILLVWIIGSPMLDRQNNLANGDQANLIPNFGSSNPMLDKARPDQAFGQYIAAGQQSGQVVGEMPEQIVIETRPMPDGTIEVLYLRQVIERQIIDYAYREMRDETGNTFPVPVRAAPIIEKSY
jgi:hypothetical protein